MTRQRVLVVGAGVGGLVSALELAAHGADVTVLERAAGPGGKLREVVLGGRALDAGPTVFTMRWVFDALFDAVGAQLDDHLALQPLSLLARHAWSADQRLDLFADVARSADAIGAFAGPQAARGYLQFCQRAQRVYRTLEQPFMRASRPDPLSLAQRVGLRGLPDLMRIAPMTTLWRALGRHFHDPRLRQLFGRYATYCGSSPFRAPGTLMLVAHVEQAGVWQVQGGMHRIAEALAALAQARGAALRYGCGVDSVLVRDGRACGVRLADGEEMAADAVVFNGDCAALASGHLGAAAAGATARRAPAARSLSAVTWNLLASTGGFPLAHHTAFFSADYAAEFADIGAGRLPAAPTVYVCAQDRGDVDGAAALAGSGDGERAGGNVGRAPLDGRATMAPSPDGPARHRALDRQGDITAPGIQRAAPPGGRHPAPANLHWAETASGHPPRPAGTHAPRSTGATHEAPAPVPERLLLIVNAPASGDTRPFTPEELARCEAQTFSTLQRCGLQVQRQPALTQMTTPQDFDRLFPATGGALYGQASHGWMASFSRPGARSRLPGLYLAGGSVHPGPGVPMAALSGRQAAASVLADRPTARTQPRPSTQPSPPTATPGGTSTR